MGPSGTPARWVDMGHRWGELTVAGQNRWRRRRTGETLVAWDWSPGGAGVSFRMECRGITRGSVLPSLTDRSASPPPSNQVFLGRTA